MSTPLTIEGNPLHTETFTIPKNATPKEAMKLMDTVSRFLTKLAVELLSQEKDGKPVFPASHPAPLAILQAASTLQNGHAQLEMLAMQQQGQFAGPGRQQFKN